MPLKVIVTNQNEPQLNNKYEFDRETITIGRDVSNSVYLPDDHKIVGREHAKIVLLEEVYQLIDVGSKNFTYLNDKPIQAGKSYSLQSGDQIKCGDFLLAISIIESRQKSDDETVFLPQSNPFIEDSEALAKILSLLYERYALETVDRRDEALKIALYHSMSKISSNNASKVIASFLNTKNGEDDIKEKPSFSESDTANESSLDILLDSVVKMLNGYHEFRTGELGETILTIKKKSSDYIDLHNCNSDDVKSFLARGEKSNDELQKRKAFIKKALDDLMRHQIALFKGYKNCVKRGTREFLDLISPATLKKETMQKQFTLGPFKLSFRFFPFLFNLKFLQVYTEKHQELINDDESFLERRVYRPGFMEAYKNYMSSGD